MASLLHSLTNGSVEFVVDVKIEPPDEADTNYAVFQDGRVSSNSENNFGDKFYLPLSAIKQEPEADDVDDESITNQGIDKDNSATEHSLSSQTDYRNGCREGLGSSKLGLESENETNGNKENVIDKEISPNITQPNSPVIHTANKDTVLNVKTEPYLHTLPTDPEVFKTVNKCTVVKTEPNLSDSACSINSRPEQDNKAAHLSDNTRSSTKESHTAAKDAVEKCADRKIKLEPLDGLELNFSRAKSNCVSESIGIGLQNEDLFGNQNSNKRRIKCENVECMVSGQSMNYVHQSLDKQFSKTVPYTSIDGANKELSSLENKGFTFSKLGAENLHEVKTSNFLTETRSENVLDENVTDNTIPHVEDAGENLQRAGNVLAPSDSRDKITDNTAPHEKNDVNNIQDANSSLVKSTLLSENFLNGHHTIPRNGVSTKDHALTVSMENDMDEDDDAMDDNGDFNDHSIGSGICIPFDENEISVSCTAKPDLDRHTAGLDSPHDMPKTVIDCLSLSKGSSSDPLPVKNPRMANSSPSNETPSSVSVPSNESPTLDSLSLNHMQIASDCDALSNETATVNLPFYEHHIPLTNTHCTDTETIPPKTSTFTGFKIDGIKTPGISNFASNQYQPYVKLEGLPQIDYTDFDVLRKDSKGKVFDFQCILCPERLCDGPTVDHHMREKHKTARPYNCDLCILRYNHPYRLCIHLKTAHKAERIFLCKGCTRYFGSKRNFEDHFYRYPAQRKQCPREKVMEPRFPCKVCGRNFKCKSYLKNVHMYEHVDERPFQCHDCGKRFPHMCSLQHHSLKHAEPPARTHQCHVCPRKYLSKSNLDAHLQTHLKEKFVRCEVCSKTFLNRSTLTSHMLVHSNIYPHECEVCGKKFKRQTQLRMHLFTHIKPDSLQTNTPAVNSQSTEHTDNTDFNNEQDAIIKVLRNESKTITEAKMTQLTPKVENIGDQELFTLVEIEPTSAEAYLFQPSAQSLAFDQHTSLRGFNHGPLSPPEKPLQQGYAEGDSVGLKGFSNGTGAIVPNGSQLFDHSLSLKQEPISP